jgi:RHS repeat-associated protein
VRYKPYGEVRGHWDRNFVSLTDCGDGQYCREFTGYDTEPISGLEYARVYDPALGMFLTQDPVREYANLYAYVAWNPINRTDPTGLVADDPLFAMKLADPTFSFSGSPPISETALGNIMLAGVAGVPAGGVQSGNTEVQEQATQQQEQKAEVGYGETAGKRK